MCPIAHRAERLSYTEQFSFLIWFAKNEIYSFSLSNLKPKHDRNIFETIFGIGKFSEYVGWHFDGISSLLSHFYAHFYLLNSQFAIVIRVENETDSIFLYVNHAILHDTKMSFVIRITPNHVRFIHFLTSVVNQHFPNWQVQF
jgi:hypothetical protein